jgi:hypothetical protein
MPAICQKSLVRLLLTFSTPLRLQHRNRATTPKPLLHHHRVCRTQGATQCDNMEVVIGCNHRRTGPHRRDPHSRCMQGPLGHQLLPHLLGACLFFLLCNRTSGPAQQSLSATCSALPLVVHVLATTRSMRHAARAHLAPFASAPSPLLGDQVVLVPCAGQQAQQAGQ